MEAEFSSEALEQSYQISWQHIIEHSKLMSADACLLGYDTVSIDKKLKKMDYTDPEDVDYKFYRNVGKYLLVSQKYSLKI